MKEEERRRKKNNQLCIIPNKILHYSIVCDVFCSYNLYSNFLLKHNHQFHVSKILQIISTIPLLPILLSKLYTVCNLHCVVLWQTQCQYSLPNRSWLSLWTNKIARHVWEIHKNTRTHTNTHKHNHNRT